MKNPNHIIELERSIKEKYGSEAIQNPKANWNTEKEQEFLSQLKELTKKEQELEQSSEIIDINGVLIPKKLFNGRTESKICIKCEKYSFKRNDDVYLTKFRTCFNCYIEFVEGREEKWLNKIEKNI